MEEKNEKIEDAVVLNDDNTLDLSPINEDEIVEFDFNSKEQKIEVLADGTEILHNEDQEEEEQISDSDLRKLVEFTRGIKDLSDDELQSLREDKNELEKLIKISIIKSKNFNYRPKKHFGVEYKKKRQRKNKQAKKSRTLNRR